jgi:hypothetical protein
MRKGEWQPSLGNPVNGIFDPSRTKQPAGSDKETFVKPNIARIASIECDGKPHVLLVPFGGLIGLCRCLEPCGLFSSASLTCQYWMAAQGEPAVGSSGLVVVSRQDHFFLKTDLPALQRA